MPQVYSLENIARIGARIKCRDNCIVSMIASKG